MCYRCWKTAVPKTPGFYYWQGDDMTGDEVAIVQVTAFRNKSKPLDGNELLLSVDGTRRPKKMPVSEFGGKWAGPIPQPHDL